MVEDATIYKVNPGPVRDSSVYISWQTLKALRMISRATGTPADAIANDVLTLWLNDKHPEVMAHISAQQQAGDEFQKQLTDKLNQGI